MPRLLIAASGTGGHIFPALVVADALPGSWNITWLGVPDRLEVGLVPMKYDLQTINVGAIQTRGYKKLLQYLKLFASIGRVCQILRRKQIQVIFTTGGYIAAPTILAAKICRIPIVLHESNAIPGKVSRLLGYFCDFVLLGLPVSASYLRSSKTIVTGTPVRKQFFLPQLLPDWAPKGSSPLIVVLGGSQGAVMLNRMVVSILPVILEKGFRVIHLIGKNDDSSEKYYQQLKSKNFAYKRFTNDISGLLQHADLVISRSGASALSEFAICEVPAILIPFPSAADNHQELNASYLAEFGAAVIVHQDLTSQSSLLNTILTLFKDNLNSHNHEPNLLDLMSRKMKEIAVFDSQAKIIKVLEGFL